MEDVSWMGDRAERLIPDSLGIGMEDSFVVVTCCMSYFLGPHCCKALVLGLVDCGGTD